MTRADFESARRDSSIRDLLTADERASVERRLVTGPFNLDTPELVFRHWRVTVEDVERGYGDIVDEYERDLSFRDELEDAVGLIAPPRQARVRALIEPWDLRFEAATDQLREPIGYPGGPVRWWAYRAPRNADAEFHGSLTQQLRYA